MDRLRTRHMVSDNALAIGQWPTTHPPSQVPAHRLLCLADMQRINLCLGLRMEKEFLAGHLGHDLGFFHLFLRHRLSHLLKPSFLSLQLPDILQTSGYGGQFDFCPLPAILVF